MLILISWALSQFGPMFKSTINNQQSTIVNLKFHMPFQDAEDPQTRTPRPPTSAERWLRRIFLEDFNLKLVALGITFVLWFAVTGQKQPLTKRFAGVQLS